MSQRTIDEYQAYLKETSYYQHAGERNAKEFAYLTLGLTGEAGEFADEFKKIIRAIGFDDPQAFREMSRENRLHLIDELGDVLWYLVHLTDQLGMNLTSLMAFNAYKLHERIRSMEDYTGPLVWPFTDPMLSESNVETSRQLTGGLK